MTNVYLASNSAFSDVVFLKEVVGELLKDYDKEGIFFNSPCGIKNGDKTCMKFICNNGYEHKFLKPRHFQDMLAESDIAILITNGESKGIELTLKQAAKLVNGTIYVVYTHLMKVDVFSFGSEPKTKDITIENGSCKIS